VFTGLLRMVGMTPFFIVPSLHSLLHLPPLHSLFPPVPLLHLPCLPTLCTHRWSAHAALCCMSLPFTLPPHPMHLQVVCTRCTGLLDCLLVSCPCLHE
jgi:hypothetical protein